MIRKRIIINLPAPGYWRTVQTSRRNKINVRKALITRARLTDRDTIHGVTSRTYSSSALCLIHNLRNTLLNSPEMPKRLAPALPVSNDVLKNSVGFQRDVRTFIQIIFEQPSFARMYSNRLEFRPMTNNYVSYRVYY